MRLLVLHQNFPGQFGHLVRAWSRRPGWDVRGIGRDTAPGLPGFDALQRYRLAHQPSVRQHPYLRTMEAATLHGQAVARVLLDMKRSGFTPDAVLAHPGWGESLYVKDVFPDTRLLHFCEWYYQAEGADLGFDPEFPLSFDDRARIRTWNALHTLNLTQCDAAIAPTQWQRSRHPEIFQPTIAVQHEGIATEDLGPDPAAALRTPSGTVLRAGDPVLTYVARNLEPYRGFHIFMRALERLQRRHATVQTLIVGGDEVSYGKRPTDAIHWREKLLREVSLDATRTHFLGRIPRAQYRHVLQVSAVHAYLTYPFVLSWSVLEAMASAALVVTSDTAPVREVVRHGHNGLTNGFFDIDGWVRQLDDALRPGAVHRLCRQSAQQAARAYTFEAGAAGYERLLRECTGQPPTVVTPLERVNLADGGRLTCAT